MTNKELQEELKKFDDDLDIEVWSEDIKNWVHLKEVSQIGREKILVLGVGFNAK